MTFSGSEPSASAADLDESDATGPHTPPPRRTIAVDLHLSSESQFFSGLSGDVAEGGLFLCTYRRLAIGEEVELELSLPGLDEPLLASGRVRWLREHTADQPRGVGVALERVSEEGRAAVERFCRARPPLLYEDI